MSASANTNALAHQEVGGSGEFSSRVPASEPLTTHGHQPGKLVGNEAAPEFSAQVLPAGTAPPEHTFKPNVAAEGEQVIPEGGEAGAPETRASETVTGATSADVA